jgi:hypothetical protein
MSASAESTIPEVHYEPDCQPEQLRQVLSSLDRVSTVTGQKAIPLRRNARHLYRTTVIVERQVAAEFFETVRREIFHVTARNVSTSGLGFITPALFVPRKSSEDAAPVRAEEVFQLGMPIKVTLGQTRGKKPVLDASIIRVLQVNPEFFEIGVAFAARKGSSLEQASDSA